MKKKYKKIVFVTLSIVIIVTLFYQVYFCSLTYLIINESSNNNANYLESDYCNVIDEVLYKRLNLFSQDSDIYETIRNAEYNTYLYFAIPEKLNRVTVHYMYSIKYERARYGENYRSCAASRIPCTVTWEYQGGFSWKIVDRYERP